MSEWKSLRIAAEMYEDVQKSRIANENRAKRGGVDIALFESQLAAQANSEAVFKKQLRATYRTVVPEGIRQWQLEAGGMGEHLVARLLGVIGHPVLAEPFHWEGTGSNRELVADEPHERTLSQLWAYCGHGDPKRRKHKGMTAEQAFALGNPRAKMLVWNLSLAAMKSMKPPYREVYEKRRFATEGRLHADVCVRCGPSGKPAQPGTPWSKGHQLADALRIVGKEILRDLWLAGQKAYETQSRAAS